MLNTLSKNWLTEKHIDFEYKKYVLLAYFQQVSRRFDESKLYPWLADLLAHYKNLLEVQENKQTLQKHFPQRLSGIDNRSGGLTFESLMEDDELMQELEQIIRFAIPLFQEHAEEGKSIYDFVEERLNLFPIGVIPLGTGQGYLFLKRGSKAETNVYEYHLTFFEHANERYRAIHTHFVRNFTKRLTTTYESIKQELVRENKNLPNPAVYAVESTLTFPLEETFLPVAKRMLVKHISSSSTD